MKIFEIITLPALLAALVLSTNVFTEIIKRIFTVKKPQILVVIIACVLSVAATIASVIMQGWVLPWQIVVAAILGLPVGGLIAYGAMFGYDELYKQAVGILGSFVSYFWKNSAMPMEGDKEEERA